MTQKIALVIDASPLIYATYETQSHLANSRGESTGLRYGFLRSVRSWARLTKANNVFLAFDLPGPVKKAEGVETYKSTRVFTEAKRTMYSQVPDLRQMLTMTAYTQVDAEGYEADDVISAICEKITSQGHKVFVQTTDNDACQLVDENVSIWMPPKSKTKTKEWLKDAAWIKEHFGVLPHHLLGFRAMVGDKSDDIEGALSCCNVGVITRCFNEAPARRLSKEEIFEVAYKINSLTSAYSRQEDLDDALNVALRLTTLHHPEKLNIVKGTRDVEGLRKYFTEELESKTLAKEPETFC